MDLYKPGKNGGYKYEIKYLAGTPAYLSFPFINSLTVLYTDGTPAEALLFGEYPIVDSVVRLTWPFISRHNRSDTPGGINYTGKYFIFKSPGKRAYAGDFLPERLDHPIGYFSVCWFCLYREYPVN